MRKSLMISIKPEHVVSILNGKKTLELRKTVPKNYFGWVYIYCTKSKPYYEPRIDGITQEKVWNIHNDFIYHTDLNGKVVARFWFDEYEEIELDFNLDIRSSTFNNYQLLKQSCINNDDLTNYFMNEDGDVNGFAWHIKQLEIFNTPLELSDFYSGYDYMDNGITDELKLTPIPLKRAPQSYQYVYTPDWWL